MALEAPLCDDIAHGNCHDCAREDGRNGPVHADVVGGRRVVVVPIDVSGHGSQYKVVVARGPI